MRMRLFLMTGLALLLVACSPEYDWRRVQPADAGFAVMLPAKPASMTRQVALEGLAIEMSLHGARIDDASYTVGVLSLPDDTPATRERVLAALRQSMVANIAGTEVATTEVRVPLEYGAGPRTGATPVQSTPGLQIRVRGQMRNLPAVMDARLVVRGNRIWQAMVLAPESAARRPGHDDSVVQFLDGFVLIAR